MILTLKPEGYTLKNTVSYLLQQTAHFFLFLLGEINNMSTADINIQTDTETKTTNTPSEITAAAIAEGKALIKDSKAKSYSSIKDLRTVLDV